jgi:hypothetical protein
MVLLLLFQAAGGVQGVAIIVAPRADASFALANSVAQLEPPVVELGSMRTRRMLSPNSLLPVPYKEFTNAVEN